MATAAITVNELPAHGKQVDPIVWTSCQNGSGDMDFANDGRTLLLARNVNAAGRTIALAGVADPYGRLTTTTMTLAALTGFSIAGPFPPPLFNIGATGRVAVVPSASHSGGDFQVAAIKLPVGGNASF
jgi:hypothetical protein